MNLFPQDIMDRVPGLYGTECKTDPICHLKLFTPDSSFTWYVLEADLSEDLLFGLVISSLCPEGELGYSSISELQALRGPLGLPVERDLHWEPMTLSEIKRRFSCR